MQQNDRPVHEQIVKAFQDLCRICHPDDVATWTPASLKERNSYIQKARTFVQLVDSFRRDQRRDLHDGAMQHTGMSTIQIHLNRTTIRPSDRSVRRALRTLGESPYPSAVCKPVTQTIHQGLGYILADQLEDENRRLHLVNDAGEAVEPIRPDEALELFDSAWLEFDADAWLARVRELDLPQFLQAETQFPPDVEQRLRQAHRSYVFGNWTAVLALCRSLLEYAVIDRLRDSIEVTELRTAKNGRSYRCNKELIDLLDEVATQVSPNQTEDFRAAATRIRKLGNEYLHAPVVPGDSSIASLESAQRRRDQETHAIDLLHAVAFVLETIYATRPLQG